MIKLHPLCELETVLCSTVGTVAQRLPMCNSFRHAPPPKQSLNLYIPSIQEQMYPGTIISPHQSPMHKTWSIRAVSDHPLIEHPWDSGSFALREGDTQPTHIQSSPPVHPQTHSTFLLFLNAQLIHNLICTFPVSKHQIGVRLHHGH